MRTNIEIDEKLMQRALAASGAPTKKAAVEQGLELLVRLNEQAKIRKWFGKIDWDGDLDEMRTSRFLDQD